MEETEREDYDSPWKEVIERFFDMKNFAIWSDKLHWAK
jgi:hypothetical protein